MSSLCIYNVETSDWSCMTTSGDLCKHAKRLIKVSRTRHRPPALTDSLSSLGSRHGLFALLSGQHSEQVQCPADGTLLPRGQTDVSRPVGQNSTLHFKLQLHPQPKPTSCFLLEVQELLALRQCGVTTSAHLLAKCGNFLFCLFLWSCTETVECSHVIWPIR